MSLKKVGFVERTEVRHTMLFVNNSSTFWLSKRIGVVQRRRTAPPQLDNRPSTLAIATTKGVVETMSRE
jgi:hypothetical protein